MNNTTVNLNLQPQPQEESSTVHLHLSPSPDHHLVIIGARAFGRETCNYARDAGWTVKGFLDDNATALDAFPKCAPNSQLSTLNSQPQPSTSTSPLGYPPILGTAEFYTPAADDVFVCAVGNSKYREKYAELLAAKGATFVNIIHPTAYIGPNVKMGVGCIICPQAMVDCDLTLGNHVDINSFAYVPHDCLLEDYVTISPSCRIGGRTTLHRGVFLGLGVTIIPDIEIGSYAYVAAGAVVTHLVPPRVLAVGVPAEVKKEL